MESGSIKEKVIKAVLATIVGMFLVGLAQAVYAWKKKWSCAQKQGNAILFYFIFMEKSNHDCNVQISTII